MLEKSNAIQFLKDFSSWYKHISKDINIVVSIPNELTKISNSENDVFLDVFDKKNQNIDAKKFLEELLEIAKKNQVNIYLEPIPRYNNIQDNISKKNKITKEYLISYYEKFGFNLLSNGFMVKYANTWFRKFNGNAPFFL